MDIFPLHARLFVQAMPSEQCLMCSVEQWSLCYGVTINNYNMAQSKNSVKLMQGRGNKIASLSFRFIFRCTLYYIYNFCSAILPPSPKSVLKAFLSKVPNLNQPYLGKVKNTNQDFPQQYTQSCKKNLFHSIRYSYSLVNKNNEV